MATNILDQMELAKKLTKGSRSSKEAAIRANEIASQVEASSTVKSEAAAREALKRLNLSKSVGTAAKDSVSVLSRGAAPDLAVEGGAALGKIAAKAAPVVAGAAGAYAADALLNPNTSEAKTMVPSGEAGYSYNADPEANIPDNLGKRAQRARELSAKLPQAVLVSSNNEKDLFSRAKDKTKEVMSRPEKLPDLPGEMKPPYGEKATPLPSEVKAPQGREQSIRDLVNSRQPSSVTASKQELPDAPKLEETQKADHWLEAALAFAPAALGGALGGTRGGLAGALAGGSALSSYQGSIKGDQEKAAEAYRDAKKERSKQEFEVAKSFTEREQKANEFNAEQVGKGLDREALLEKEKSSEAGADKRAKMQYDTNMASVAAKNRDTDVNAIINNRKLDQESNKRKILPAKQASDMAELASSLSQSEALIADIEANKSNMGPIAGLKSLNPWSDASQFKSNLFAHQQLLGKAAEGGVLREGDWKKYGIILPTIYDDPERAKAKVLTNIRIVREQLKNKSKFLNSAGYDATDIDNIIDAQTAGSQPLKAESNVDAQYQSYLKRIERERH